MTQAGKKARADIEAEIERACRGLKLEEYIEVLEEIEVYVEASRDAAQGDIERRKRLAKDD
jgi:hypothetical protein